MAGTPGGLTASIRRKLQDGKTPEEIIQELVASGLTETSAQRFVDRAITEAASAPDLPPLPDAPAPADSLDQFIQTKSAETAAAAAKTGRAQLWVASSLMCGGILITAISYIMADVGERYITMWGPIVFGGLIWGRAVIQGFGERETFAWFTALATAVAPIVLAVAMLGVVSATEPEGESDLQAQMDEIFEKSKDAPRPDPKAITIKEVPPAPSALPEVERLLYDFDNARAASIQCEMARRLSFTEGDDKAVAVTGLVGRFGMVSDEVKVCITRAVQRLDPKAADTLKPRQ